MISKTKKLIFNFLILFTLFIIFIVPEIYSDWCSDPDPGGCEERGNRCCTDITCEECEWKQRPNGNWYEDCDIVDEWHCGWACRGQCGGEGGGGGGGSGPRCGDNTVNQASEECDGTFAVCGFASNACATCKCEFYFGSITTTATTPCINNSDSSKLVTVSGRSSYCGNVTLLTSWGYQKVITGVDNFTYSDTFALPQNVIQNHITTGIPITIEVRGNRNDIKNSTFDEASYDCDETVNIALTFDNFYYCPKPGETYNDDFDFYDDTSYYTFYNDNQEYDWEDCISNQNTQVCAGKATDCVAKDGNTYPADAPRDADNDVSGNVGEYEVCYSEDGIQGGWLDADANTEACEKVDGNFLRKTVWFDCQPTTECTFGIDDFAVSQRGLCCGDEKGEIPYETPIRRNGQLVYLNGNFKACCQEFGTHSCVDEYGICRAEDYSACFGEGLRGTCTDSEWILTDVPSCTKSCTVCDINKEDTSAGNVDIRDLTVIENWYQGGNPYNATYDTNKDLRVDSSDVEFCRIYLGPCNACTDKILQTDEECSVNQNNVIEYNNNLCPQTKCVGNKQWTRLADCLACNCLYNIACVKGQCGASCGNDADCGSNHRCNQETCSCELIGCPPGTTLCEDGTCSNNCDQTDTGNQGCIEEPNGECIVGEGCACSDCLGKRDSCAYGSICGADELCGCPVGTTLCEDGTCSANCRQTDGDNEGCINKNTVCELGEGCACSDCHNQQDSCVAGAVCDYYSELCQLPCIPTENPEYSIDGKDNDCDGLVDEPEFWPGYGVYIWEANCNYYMCTYADDSKDHTTTGTLTVDGNYKIYRVKEYGWELVDSFSVAQSEKQVTFTSKIYNDIDCLIFKSDTTVKYDLNLNGSRDTSTIYLTQRKFNPISNPFYYASPECTLSCTSPENCGNPSILFGREGCSYEECIFDCGGNWINVTSTFDALWPNSNLGDYCIACIVNMTCSNYTNMISCLYDPCTASMTQFGCDWNFNTNKCEDAFNYCGPRTTLCKDGTCSVDCERTDWENAGCIGPENNKCEIGEGCACEDCEGERDSCILGAICGKDELCGCPEDTTLCVDNTCDDTCEGHGGPKGCIGEANNRCEIGEGCACEDCDGLRDSCISGLYCNYYLGICINPFAEECPPGTTLCNDLTCDETCEDNGGKRGCIGIANGKCEKGEGCACVDCEGEKDSCERGAVCNYEDELCEETEEGEVSSCTDLDEDGYYKEESTCPGGDDCDDTTPEVHPGATEICNGKDDDCNGKIDDNCVDDLAYGLDLSLGGVAKLRILEKFKFKAVIKNNLEKKFTDLLITLDLPDKDKFMIDKNSVKIDEINPKETKEVYFEVIIRDYRQESAVFKLNAKLPDSRIVTKEIPLNVEIPEFLVAPMPMFRYEEQNKKRCYNLYYVINNKNLNENVDIELDIVNPSSVFGKSVQVDYIASINPEKKLLINPFITEQYCLPLNNDYEIRGYLYKSGFWKIVDTVDESIEEVSTR